MDDLEGCESVTKLTLPRIPPVPIMTPFDCSPGSGPHAGIHLESVLSSIAKYNRFMKLVDHPGTASQWEQSAEVIRAGKQVTRIVERANEEIQWPLTTLFQGIDNFSQAINLEIRHFENGLWAALLDREFELLMQCWTFPDPTNFLRVFIIGFRHALRHAGPQHRWRKRRSLTRKLKIISNRLVCDFHDGKLHAFELYVSVKKILQEIVAEDPHSSRTGLAEVDQMLLDLLRSKTGGASSAKDAILDVDMAATKRQLIATLSSPPNSPIDRTTPFWDERKRQYDLHLEVLQEIQAQAHAQIRTKIIILTIGTLVPNDVTEMLIDFALVAEEIPRNPNESPAG